ncbi:hypothetical protein BDB01DRAFT_703829, partial [Pilobolus umbonatus]
SKSPNCADLMIGYPCGLSAEAPRLSSSKINSFLFLIVASGSSLNSRLGIFL